MVFYSTFNNLSVTIHDRKSKNYKIGICCFSAMHMVLRRKSPEWLTQKQVNVSEWSDISTYGLLFQ